MPLALALLSALFSQSMLPKALKYVGVDDRRFAPPLLRQIFSDGAFDPTCALKQYLWASKALSKNLTFLRNEPTREPTPFYLAIISLVNVGL
jgi:hypothetical protein